MADPPPDENTPLHALAAHVWVHFSEMDPGLRRDDGTLDIGPPDQGPGQASPV